MLANYNIRKTLNIARRIITSSVFKIDEIIKSYIVGKKLSPNYRKFIQALIQGDYSLYRPIENEYIFPIFSVSENKRYSPLLPMRVLVLLRQARNKNQTVEERHHTIENIVSYFDGMGVSDTAAKAVIEQLLNADLVEPFDLSDREMRNDQRVAITSKGMAHIDLALFNDNFFGQMMITTKINDPEVVREIRSIRDQGSKLGKEAWQQMFRCFGAYLLREDAFTSAIPGMERYEGQNELTAEIKLRWVDRVRPPQKQGTTLTSDEQECTVEWFDRTKGFGFVRVDALRENAFLHVSALEKFGVHTVADGETITATLTSTPRGLSVKSVVSVGAAKSLAEDNIFEGVIIRLVRDRGFGFVSSPKLDEDAFFHFTVFDETQRSMLREGLKLRFTAITGREGKAFQVAKLLSVLG